MKIKRIFSENLLKEKIRYLYKVYFKKIDFMEKDGFHIFYNMKYLNKIYHVNFDKGLLKFYNSPGRGPVADIASGSISEYLNGNPLKVGDVVVDAGAYSGTFTLIASKLVGERGKVIAFEPDPISFKRLRKNLKTVRGLKGGG